MIRLTASRLSLGTANVALLLLPVVCAACSSTGSTEGVAGGSLGDGGQILDGGKRAESGSTKHADAGKGADSRTVADVGPDHATLVDGGADGPGVTVPTVIATAPTNGAGNVPLNANVAATFSEAMKPASITAGSTFQLTVAAAMVPGTVTYGESTAIFQPTVQLTPSGMYTATITTAATSVLGSALAANYSWSFTTGTATAELPVNLGGAGNYVIVAKTGISTVPISAITGNLAVSPAAATYITGFSLKADPTNVFSTSTQVTGEIFAATYKPPTPADLTTAVDDMLTAFTDAASRAPGVTELGAGNIGGKTLAAGVYKWGTGLLIPSDVTLSGSSTDVWVFQIAKGLTMSSAAKVVLSGGAVSKNVFWQVAGMVDLGTTAHCEGVILSQTAITLQAGASVNGRLLAQTAVTLASSTVVEPAP